jgi:NADP-dependent 3-hydroxy acid dehydrogenase YdfG
MSAAALRSSPGVGPGLGAALARGKRSVGLVARDPDFIEDLAREICTGGGKALGMVVDVSRPDEVKSAVGHVRAELWKIKRPLA